MQIGRNTAVLGAAPQKRRSFQDYWMVRLLRRSSRDIVGHSMEVILPVPDRMRDKVINWASPKSIYLERKVITYKDWINLLESGQRLSLPKYFTRTLGLYYVSSFMATLVSGEIYNALTRICLLGYTAHLVLKKGKMNIKKRIASNRP